MSANCTDALTHLTETRFVLYGETSSIMGQETFKELAYIIHVKLGFQNPF